MDNLQNKIQFAINSIDDGILNLILRIIMFLFVGVLVAGGFAWTQFRGLDNPDAMNYAQIARNMASGRGFVSGYINPIDAKDVKIKTDKDGRIFVPETRVAPVYPWLLSLGFKIIKPDFIVQPDGKLFAPEVKVIIPMGIIFLILTAIITFLLGTHLFDQRVGIIAMLLMLVNIALLNSAVFGGILPVVVFFANLMVLAVLYGRSPGRSNLFAAGMAVFSGVMCALTFLTLYSMIIFLPLMLLLIWSLFEGNRRLLFVAVFVISFVVCVTPWLIRNQTISGNPFGTAQETIMHDTYTYPGNLYDRQVNPDVGKIVMTWGIKNKIKVNFIELIQDNMGWGMLGIIGALFLVSFIRNIDNYDKMVLKWMVLAGSVMMIFIVSIVGKNNIIFISVFFPLMIIYGVYFFENEMSDLTNYIPGYRNVPGTILVLLAALPAVLTIAGLRGKIPYPPYYPPLISYVSNMLSPNELLYTDIPQAVSWYGNHSAVLAPAKVDDIPALETNMNLKCAGIYLAKGKEAGEDISWREFRKLKIPKDFPLKDGVLLPPTSKDQIFVSDRKRWK